MLVREQFLQIGFVGIGIGPGGDHFSIETEIDFGKERMYDVIDRSGNVISPRQVSSVPLGEFADQLNVGLREIHIFVPLSLDFKFNGGIGGRIGIEGAGNRVIFYPFGFF